MIACEICESPQFLNIIESRIHFDVSSEDPDEVYEKYECVMCGPTAVGSLEITEDGEKELTGTVIDIEQERPRAEI